MCNIIDRNCPSYQKEPEEGEGWKIFSVYEDGLYAMQKMGAPVGSMRGPRYIQNEWIHFKPQLEDCGFCFFLDKKIAEYVLKQWQMIDPFLKYENFTYQICRIYYKECLGSMNMPIISLSGERGAIAQQILI